MLSQAARHAAAPLRTAAALLLAASLVQAGYEEMPTKGSCKDSQDRGFNMVAKIGLGSGYLATCQAACDAIPLCIGMSVRDKYTGPSFVLLTACYLNGEGLKSNDIAAVEQASGSVGGWKYTSGTGSGSIAGTSGSSGWECHKKNVTTTTTTTTTATNTTATTTTTTTTTVTTNTTATTTTTTTTTETTTAALITTTAAPIAVSTASATAAPKAAADAGAAARSAVEAAAAVATTTAAVAASSTGDDTYALVAVAVVLIALTFAVAVGHVGYTVLSSKAPGNRVAQEPAADVIPATASPRTPRARTGASTPPVALPAVHV